ncbi:MAG TPA: hypothetical protein VH482_02075 [Thermomicrobiales bacterium]|jgi:hypothetical protein
MSRLIACLLIASALLAGASSVAAAQEGSPEAGYPARNLSLLEGLGLPEINLVATDSDVTGAPTEVEAGRYFVTLDNQSVDDEIEVYFVVLPASVTQEQAMADLNSDSDEAPGWFYEATWAGGPNAYLGQKDGAVVELAAGDWFIAVDRSGESGPAGQSPDTTSALKVTGELTAGEGIVGAVPVNLKEYTFEIPASVAAGPQIWELTNTGKQPHFLAVAQVPDGTTFDQVMGLIAFAFTGTPQANLSLGFEDVQDVYDSSVVSAAQRTWIQMDLDPGTYVAICFIPDQETQQPHAAMGMVQVFTVG